MFDVDNIRKIYIDAFTANYLYLDYLKKCRITLFKVGVLNTFIDLADKNLVNEAQEKTKCYMKELKQDKYNLKAIRSVINNVYKHGINMFDDDFAALIKCFELKSISIANSTEYYIKKIESHVNNVGYPALKENDKVDEYNRKINSLILKLGNNGLDNNE